MLRHMLMAAIAAMMAGQALAQDATPANELPTIVEPTPEERGQETGVMSGEKPFFLTTDPSGELIYNFDEETNELDSISARKDVVFSSEDMTLNADQLDYKNKTAELVASGKRVVVRQGEIIATCQLFKYNSEKEQSELSGNPVVYNRTRDGKVTKTEGDKILFYRVNGKPQIKVFGGTRAPRLDSGRGVPAAPAGVMRPAAPAGAASMQSFDDPVPGPGGPMMSGNSEVLNATPAGEAGTGDAATTSGGVLGIPSSTLNVGQ